MIPEQEMNRLKFSALPLFQRGRLNLEKLQNTVFT